MQDDEKIRKNKPVPESEPPDWMGELTEEEREAYIHSPQCLVCNAIHDGRNLRSEIEALVIERKTHVEVCNIIFERYGLRLAPHNVSRHMSRHAPVYATVSERLMESDLGKVLRGDHGPIIDEGGFLVLVLQLSSHNALLYPERVTVKDGIAAAEKLLKLSERLNINRRADAMDQGDVTKILDIIHMVMTEEQREEVKRRWGDELAGESTPPAREEAAVGIEGETGVVVDGQYIAVSDILVLPAEESGDGESNDRSPGLGSS